MGGEITAKALEQLFDNNFSCWAATCDGADDVMAMDRATFVRVVGQLLDEASITPAQMEAWEE